MSCAWPRREDLAAGLRLPADWLDHTILAICFVVVLGIGFAARRSVGEDEPGLLPLQYGVYTTHWYWIGATPAMVFLGLAMMPFLWGSEVRSMPESLLPRFDRGGHLLSSVLFTCAAILIAGVKLYALAIVVEALPGRPQWVSIVVAGAPMGRDPYAHSGSARYSGTKTSTGVCASDARVNQVKAVPPSNTP